MHTVLLDPDGFVQGRIGPFSAIGIKDLPADDQRELQATN
jgi:hypothetical protein